MPRGRTPISSLGPSAPSSPGVCSTRRARRRRRLGTAPTDDEVPDVDELPRLISAVGRLRSGAGAGAGDALDAHARALERLRRRYESRAEAIERAHAAAAGLRSVPSPEGVLADAPRALAVSSTLRRVVLSRVRDGALHVETIEVRDDAEQAAAGARRDWQACRSGSLYAADRGRDPAQATRDGRQRRAARRDRAHRPAGNGHGVGGAYVAAAVVAGGEPGRPDDPRRPRQVKSRRRASTATC